MKALAGIAITELCAQEIISGKVAIKISVVAIILLLTLLVRFCLLYTRVGLTTCHAENSINQL